MAGTAVAGMVAAGMGYLLGKPQMWQGRTGEARGDAMAPRVVWPRLRTRGEGLATVPAMTDRPAIDVHRTERSVRLDTLVRLRWLAVVGQTTAVLVVYYGLDYELPIWGCLAVIALAAWLNVALRIRF